MTRELREQLVLDLLQSEWSKANTEDLTPNITFGWYDQKTEGTPLLTVAQAREGPTGGGTTRYDVMTADGSGPEQTMTGTVDCDIWTHRDDLANASTNSQNVYNGRAADEIARIIRANASEPTNPRTGNQPVTTVAPGDSFAVREEDKHGVRRRQMPVQYVYHTND